MSKLQRNPVRSKYNYLGGGSSSKKHSSDLKKHSRHRSDDGLVRRQSNLPRPFAEYQLYGQGKIAEVDHSQASHKSQPSQYSQPRSDTSKSIPYRSIQKYVEREPTVESPKHRRFSEVGESVTNTNPDSVDRPSSLDRPLTVCNMIRSSPSREMAPIRETCESRCMSPSSRCYTLAKSRSPRKNSQISDEPSCIPIQVEPSGFLKLRASRQKEWSKKEAHPLIQKVIFSQQSSGRILEEIREKLQLFGESLKSFHKICVR